MGNSHSLLLFLLLLLLFLFLLLLLLLRHRRLPPPRPIFLVETSHQSFAFCFRGHLCHCPERCRQRCSPSPHGYCGHHDHPSSRGGAHRWNGRWLLRRGSAFWSIYLCFRWSGICCPESRLQSPPPPFDWLPWPTSILPPAPRCVPGCVALVASIDGGHGPFPTAPACPAPHRLSTDPQDFSMPALLFGSPWTLRSWPTCLGGWRFVRPASLRTILPWIGAWMFSSRSSPRFAWPTRHIFDPTTTLVLGIRSMHPVVHGAPVSSFAMCRTTCRRHRI